MAKADRSGTVNHIWRLVLVHRSGSFREGGCSRPNRTGGLSKMSNCYRDTGKAGGPPLDFSEVLGVGRDAGIAVNHVYVFLRHTAGSEGGCALRSAIFSLNASRVMGGRGSFIDAS